jgi:transcriptional regulator with XRE-family HTH domain
MQLGPRIKELRKAAGLTQEGLARKANMSLNGFGLVERSERTDPQLSTLKKISQALGISISELVKDETN